MTAFAEDGLVRRHRQPRSVRPGLVLERQVLDQAVDDRPFGLRSEAATAQENVPDVPVADFTDEEILPTCRLPTRDWNPIATAYDLRILGRMLNVAQIHTAIETGDPTSAAELLPLVYDELRKLAATRLADERPGQTLQPTALVHEAYLRIVGGSRTQDWNGSGHFFAAAAEAMRRILVDRARHKKTIKAGGELRRLDLDAVDPALEESDATTLMVYRSATSSRSIHSPQGYKATRRSSWPRPATSSLHG
jgi:RNA polymerase sigma factor (TIGR02999 family)